MIGGLGRRDWREEEWLRERGGGWGVCVVGGGLWGILTSDGQA